MTTYIHMDGNPEDVEVRIETRGDETMFLIKSESMQETVALTPEGARSLGFLLMGMTDALRKEEE